MNGSLLVGGERAEDLRARTMARIDRLRPHFTIVEVLWECVLRDRLAENTEEGKEMKKFFDSVEVRGCPEARLYVLRTTFFRLLNALK